MFFDTPLSAAGRATEEVLTVLRVQFGAGVDPARECVKAPTKPDIPITPSESAPGPPSVEVLWGNIADLLGIPSQPNKPHNTKPENPFVAKHLERLDKRDAAAKPKPVRPSSAFQARSRSDIDKLDVNLRFRAPPIGVYRPAVLPRAKGTVPFGLRPGSAPSRPQARSLKINVEVGDPVEKPALHISVVDFGKLAKRKEFFKDCGVVYNENSFTENLAEADMNSSKFTSQPCFAWMKASGQASKTELTYGEPGLYNVKDDVVRPSSGRSVVKFATQCPRAELGNTSSEPGQDILLSGKICPILSSERRILSVPDFGKDTSRPPLVPKQDDEPVLSPNTAYLNDTVPNKSGRRPDPFSKGLTRDQHLRSMRLYGNDFTTARIRDNLEHGPVSVEYADDVTDRPIFKKPVKSPRFSQMPGRENFRHSGELPARKKPPGRSFRFSRNPRAGESKCKTSQVQQMSNIMEKLSVKRYTRTFESMNEEDLAVFGWSLGKAQQ